MVSNNKSRFPDIYIILLLLTAVCAVLTWIIPAGSFEREVLENGRQSVIAGSYKVMAQTPISFMGFVMSIPKGMRSAADIVFLTLLVGGSVGVIRRTGVIDLGINKLLVKLNNNVAMLISALMLTFGTIAAFIGIPELSIAYLPIVLPLMLRVGCDSVTATAMVLLSSTLGFAFGITVPATVGIGHMLAELPMFSGAAYRSVFFLIIQLTAIFYVYRYAKKVMADPSSGFNSEVDKELRADLSDSETAVEYTDKQRLAGLVAGVGLFGIIASILYFRLGFDAISGLFIFLAIGVSLTAGVSGNKTCGNFNESFREILTGALICGLARAISIVLMEGNIMDTMVNALVTLLSTLPTEFTALGILFAQTLFNFFVPSGSGQSLISLPILLPMADLIGITRQVVVLATHWGDGITNILFPTSGYFIATLVIGKVSYKCWLKFYFPLLIGIVGIAASGIIIAQLLNIGPF